MSRARAALALLLLAAVGLALVSGGSDSDPRTPPALPGMPPPFLGTAVVGDGGMTAAIDAYGDVVDLRAPGPAGRALIDNPSGRQAAGTVPAGTGIVPRLRVGDGPWLPVWRADSVAQHYLPDSDVVRTEARFGAARLIVEATARGGRLAILARASDRDGQPVRPALRAYLEPGVTCDESGVTEQVSLVCAPGNGAGRVGAADEEASVERPGEAAGAIVSSARTSAHRWLTSARPLGSGAPAWARAMYRRSLLVLQSLTSSRTGAVAAGARDGWAYVWPRDAATASLAFAAAGYRTEARRVARFLDGLDLGAAARFDETGAPVPGRGPEGDATGWVAAAARATGLHSPPHTPWRELPDYQEGAAGDYLGNFLAASPDVSELKGAYEPLSSDTSHGGGAEIGLAFETGRGLVRRAGDPASGLDSAAAWAVRPFSQPSLYPAAARTLLTLAAQGARFGITPGEGWTGGPDPWSAPTAWSAWSLAALWRMERGAAAARDRSAALGLLDDLRRAATPAGALPERVGVRTGIPTSTTPLAWSHAFAVLALQELWPGPRRAGPTG